MHSAQRYPEAQRWHNPRSGCDSGLDRDPRNEAEAAPRLQGAGCSFRKVTATQAVALSEQPGAACCFPVSKAVHRRSWGEDIGQSHFNFLCAICHTSYMSLFGYGNGRLTLLKKVLLIFISRRVTGQLDESSEFH